MSKSPALRGAALRGALLSGYAPAQDAARRRILAALAEHGGNVTETAAALGVAVSTLYDWRRRDPELERRFRDLAQGREGSRRAAAAARRRASRQKPG